MRAPYHLRYHPHVLPLTFPLQRFFVALPLQDEALATFQSIQNALSPFKDCLRLANPKNPHITLHFWEEMSVLECKRVEKTCAAIVQEIPSFTLYVSGSGIFSSHSRVRVLFLHIDEHTVLTNLISQLPWKRDRDYVSHITLARVSHPGQFAVERKKIEKGLENLSFALSVDRIRLYADIDGKKQSPIKDFLLRGCI